MQAIERPFAARLAIIIDSAAKKAGAAVVEQGQDVALDGVLPDLESDFMAIFMPAYTRTAKIFGDRLLDAFKSHDDFETKAEDYFSQAMQLWIRTTSAEKVTNVSKTTKKNIRAAIDEGFGAEMTGTQLASHIVEKTGGEIAAIRASIIARTETHMAAQHATQEAAKSTQIPMKRIWIAAADERTRTRHAAEDRDSHSAPVSMDEPFRVMELMYPGDPSGPAEEVINCRCVVAYVT